ncbi:T9SS type A sorting domain-containing protein [Subsaxibacter sp. CAU 1640]|uniref:T9SS type A sorting domain-containing protein n=1 Tax=Subsaxibacter sp. CAU 1640 TaxID=2933271 RepID=UPI0020048C2F|nr:T9SS type A sorting domain-containing protein [Subsaxibacter sp. CAU 1640]MCK7590240.1 T9SS type A sorting domain-containing protein [Subsaxibacter sp. CAU 1640]
MKKLIVLSLALTLSVFSFGQSPIATIDRANGAGPTTTSTVANMSAIGLTRTGVIQVGTTGSFTSRNWETGTALNTARYIQWSISANSNYNIRLTELDIRYRRNNNQAPKQIQIFYSLDGFNPAGANPNGFAIGAVQTYANNDTAQKTIVLPVSNVSSGNGGTITFRMYGWDAANTNGELIIEANTAWAGTLGVANPGVRLIGNVYRELTYSGGTWTPIAPSSTTGGDNAVVVNGTYTPASNIALNFLTVRPAGSLNIPSGVTATTNSTTLESNSTLYSSLILNGTLTGTVSYNRHINGQPGVGVGSGANDLISAPLSGQTFSAFAAANPNLRSNPSVPTQKLFGPFSKTTGNYLLWDTTTNGSQTLTAGVGYRTASTNNGGFVFTGTPNNGIITNNIANSGPQFAAYNLIGNPYPSYLNVREFLEYDVDAGAPVVRNIDLMDAYGAIYGYDGDASGTGGDGWVVYNLTTPTTVNMAPGQGFFVTADAADVAAYDMTFTPSMRRIGNTDDFIPGRLADDNTAHIKLQASIGSSIYSTDICFNEASTSGLDFGYDAAVFGSNAASKSIYSHLVENNNGADLAIQSLAYASLGSEISIPLGINVSQGQQVTVSISELDVPSTIEVYLEDSVSGVYTLLNNSSYTFTPSTNLNDTGRFFLRFADATLSAPDSQFTSLQIYATSSSRILFVKGLLQGDTTISVYDLQGRLVTSANLNKGTTSNIIDVASLNSGVYVVKLDNSSQQKTQKIILK